MADEQIFTEVTPGLRLAYASDKDMLVIFGDPLEPRHVETIPRTDALKAGVALAAAAVARPLYSRVTIAAALTGAAMSLPPSRVTVIVRADDGSVFEADALEVDIHKTTGVLVTRVTDDEDAGTTVEVQPSQILYMDVQRPPR